MRKFFMLTRYALMHRLGIRPWEKYSQAAADSLARLLSREEAQRGGVPGRALDVGCGRGSYTHLLAHRGWDAVGIDAIEAAVAAAAEEGDTSATFVQVNVAEPLPPGLGTFDFFLDVGCFQGFSASQRQAAARSLTGAARPGATLLLLCFVATPLRRLIGGTSREEVEEAFSSWTLLSSEPAPTDRLGWPMSRTKPQWYRLAITARRSPS